VSWNEKYQLNWIENIPIWGQMRRSEEVLVARKTQIGVQQTPLEMLKCADCENARWGVQ
jgi:hypothetical protein